MQSKEILPGWLRTHRRYILAVVDAVLVALALALAYFIKSLDVAGWDVHYALQYRLVVPVVIVSQILLFVVFHLYRGLLRYAGLTELKVIVVATTIVTGGMVVFDVLTPWIRNLGPMWPMAGGRPLRIPYSVVSMYWMLDILLVGGFRFSRRLILSTFRRQDGRNVIVVGVHAGEPAVRDMLHNPSGGYDPVGLVDPNPLYTGQRIHGVPVLGTIPDLSRIIAESAADEVIIALPEATGGEIRAITEICRNKNVQAKILPALSKIISGQVSISAIRPVTIEDILGRDPVRLELPPEMNYIRGRCVLVTGAGGSIGSEIVRQIVKLDPAKVVLLGRGENSLFDFAAELNIGVQDERFPIVIANVCDPEKMRAVFREYRPAVVFHAAAHKHVHFMEINPEEAIKNNVFGTQIVAELAGKFGVERFILISTDKAVRPTNVMGASKRIAEMVVWEVASRSRTRFVAVRFGNVLGSRGSVVPVLKRQIAAGGPVTITHRDMTRYFMTIPEAASLVVQAGALNEAAAQGSSSGSSDVSDRSDQSDSRAAPQGGRLFVLDMGEPVKIIDLIHNLIALSGFRPDRDIEIVEIGPRPGEKIREELLTDGETVKATQFGKVFMTESDAVETRRLHDALERLERAAIECDRAEIRSILKELVPDYMPEE